MEFALRMRELVHRPLPALLTELHQGLWPGVDQVQLLPDLDADAGEPDEVVIGARLVLTLQPPGTETTPETQEALGEVRLGRRPLTIRRDWIAGTLTVTY